jgi:taurine--2-oxoglutarate transaminase
VDFDEIRRLDLAHDLHSWSVQGTVDPLVFDHGQGAVFWDKRGKRFLDFAAQLVNLNTGHQHPRVVAAIKRQAEICCTCAPGFAHEPKSLLGKMLAEVTPGTLDKFFYTLGGAEANENAVKISRMYTGKHKILARWRSYHGATYGAITLSGDPRRPPVEPGIPGVVHVLDPFCYRCSFGLVHPQCDLQCLKHIHEVMLYENPDTIAAIIIEPVTGTNGIIVPPDGYLQGLRSLCDQYGILLIADEVMSGFGRTGRWFAIDHWGVTPDMITMAKGLTSGYLPLGAVALSADIARYFDDRMFWSGLTYSGHPLSCAAAVATLMAYKEEDLIEGAARKGRFLKEELEGLKERHPCVGDVRCIGLFALIELVKDKQSKEPLVKWNAQSAGLAVSKEINRRLLESGVYTVTRWNWIFVTPPLVVTESELKEGLCIIDEILTYIDGLV